MPRPRAQCPACSRSIAVTRDGRLWPHRDPVGSRCPVRRATVTVPPGADEPVRLHKPVVNVIGSL